MLQLDRDKSIPQNGDPMYADKYFGDKGFPLSRTGKMQRTWSTPIIQGEIHEPLTRWKSLAAVQRDWPTTYHRYHLEEGIVVQDQDTVVVNARDEQIRTGAGAMRKSSGKVVFSFKHQQEAMLDAEDVIRIITDESGGGLYRHWHVDQIDKEFLNRWGRHGIWRKKGLSLSPFLSSFQKTFEVFGSHHQYVRLRHPWGRNSVPRILDNMDQVMVNLARLLNPRLMRYQNVLRVNEKPIKGAHLPGSSEHDFSTNLRPVKKIPHQCFSGEENEKYGVALPLRVMEVITAPEALP